MQRAKLTQHAQRSFGGIRGAVIVRHHALILSLIGVGHIGQLQDGRRLGHSARGRADVGLQNRAVHLHVVVLPGEMERRGGGACRATNQRYVVPFDAHLTHGLFDDPWLRVLVCFIVSFSVLARTGFSAFYSVQMHGLLLTTGEVRVMQLGQRHPLQPMRITAVHLGLAVTIFSQPRAQPVEPAVADQRS